MTFVYSPETVMDHYDLVYCCISIDGYEPDLMIKQGTDYVLT